MRQHYIEQVYLRDGTVIQRNSQEFLHWYWKSTDRRRRDLNPRAAINDLHPFQGCLFNLLSTSPKVELNIKYLIMFDTILPVSSGEDGIRTHAPLRTNGFQDRLVMTTSIPLRSRTLISARDMIAKRGMGVNRFFKKIFKIFEQLENCQVLRDIFTVFPTSALPFRSLPVLLLLYWNNRP